MVHFFVFVLSRKPKTSHYGLVTIVMVVHTIFLGLNAIVKFVVALATVKFLYSAT